ncbi:MAG: 30S ribosomal protein S21 [Candidatus Marinimicrobia bacterium]|nr:30S ribosomal protein S21 [Candidatus Neomarinimicrobiota bacterium]
MPVMVTVKRDEPFEKALRRFKKKYEKAGILKDVKKNSFYLKPTEERRLRRAKAAKRARQTRPRY